ncbi:ligase-associated DNA damage response endonuclease PdeM [Lichenicoccus sp.]|uniref:ligase-associated DNA damage response endonuclease PdeM n=1 Tax=Lichenicoccus sp. TaxID=2781899 RepID=UPI003D0E3804
MIASAISVAGERLLLDPRGVLYWPAARLLAVADLHLEKGSAMARDGGLVPPWDSAITLRRLVACIEDWRPEIVVALGDSFHDRDAIRRLNAADAATLRGIAARARLVWIRGNHDPEAPAGLPGEPCHSFTLGPLRLRHEAVVATELAELCGHHHPKARIATRGGTVSRPCFVASHRRLMLPAFGAYTGGLDVSNPAIARLFPGGGSAFLLGDGRLFRFALGPAPAGENPGRPRMLQVRDA